MATHHTDPQLAKRLQHLESHLDDENPLLRQVVRDFRELDRVAHGMGMFGPGDSHAIQVSWWPIISILGIYSAGKSTFINEYLGHKLQFTGNQAVDDKFTVVTYSDDPEPRTLPGLALDADPRFPFYQISRDIEEVAAGEGDRIDAYLQLKTCDSDVLKGKILIDSPGFDADEQRTAVLRLTNHIVNLSDLVMVFFDARKPEAGTMADTLNHLVADTINRQDSNKFLYILNQMDTTAREDNAEDIIASWERALSQKGLTAGRFYRIYSNDAAVPIDDENVRTRYQAKRDEDMAEIDKRVQGVSVERSYRIIGSLETAASQFAEVHVPKLQGMLASWRKSVIILDVLMLAAVAAGVWFGGLLPYITGLLSNADTTNIGVSVAVLVVIGGLHCLIRKLVANTMVANLKRRGKDQPHTDSYVSAFRKNTRFFRTIFGNNPVGWNRRAKNIISDITVNAAEHVQKLNSSFTNPSGRPKKVAAAPVAASATATAAAPATDSEA